MAGRTGLTSSQRGTIAEVYLAATLITASDGRLSPFTPVADDHGIDLVVMDKETGRCVPVQVKAWLGEARQKVQFDVRRATFRPDAGGAVVALLLDPATMRLDAAWMIPMDKIPGVSSEYAEKYAMAPNPSAESRDRYAEFRHADPASLAAALIRLSGG